MNKIISKIGAVVVTITVFLFAICLIADLSICFISRVYVFTSGIHYDGSRVSI